jgi:hypothetical protein
MNIRLFIENRPHYNYSNLLVAKLKISIHVLDFLV